MVIIDLSDKSFFYDVMSLAGEFYPGETIREKTDDYEENEKDIIIKVPSPDEKAKRLENKNVIKRALYRDLSERTGKILPWGTLSGIRPVKLITSYLENGLSPEDTKKVLFDEYYISQEKAERASV